MLLTDVILPQATELFLRAVQEEQSGAVYEGVYVEFMVIKINSRGMICWLN